MKFTREDLGQFSKSIFLILRSFKIKPFSAKLDAIVHQNLLVEVTHFKTKLYYKMEKRSMYKSIKLETKAQYHKKVDEYFCSIPRSIKIHIRTLEIQVFRVLAGQLKRNSWHLQDFQRAYALKIHLEETKTDSAKKRMHVRFRGPSDSIAQPKFF